MKTRRIIPILAGLFILLLATGCGGRTVKIAFQADNHINEGVLLPVDIIAVQDSAVESVLDIGPETWFGHRMRERLISGKELFTFALSGGAKRKVKISVPKENKRVLVYADYENSEERDDQQVVITPSGWHFGYYLIKVTGHAMELEK